MRRELKQVVARLPFVERLALSARTEWQARRPREVADYTIAGADALLDDFEPDVRAWVASDAFDVLIDVGAHVGLYTLLARSLGKQVVAIEPHPLNQRLLYQNLLANGWDDVECHGAAVGDRVGLIELHGAGTGASIGGTGSVWATPITTLDSIVGDRFGDRRIGVKVDAEGAELAVLSGAERLLAAGCTWIVEVDLFLDPTGVWDIFDSHGYRCQWTETNDHISREALMELAAKARTGPVPNGFIFAR